MQYNWNWSVLLQEPYYGWIWSGFSWTLATGCAAWVIAISLGSVIGVMRTTHVPILRSIGTCYVELFRNIPLLVQMLLWYFVFPELLSKDAGMWVKREMPMPEYSTAVICLGTYHASRVAEQVRAGIESIGQGQRYAGLAIGLTQVRSIDTSCCRSPIGLSCRR